MLFEIIGHRGARFEAPENTLAGFRYAKRIGIMSMEFDVRRTKDDGFVVIHDATVDRTTNGTGPVSGLTVAELQALDARSIHPDWPEPCPVPALAEVLETLADTPHMQIEIKKDTPQNMELVIEGVLGTMAQIGRTEGIVITSFEPLALEIARRRSPEQPRGLIGDWSAGEMFADAKRLDVSKACINLDSATPEIVARAKDAGYRTVGWPCNTPEAVEKILACDFDEVSTDAPSTIRPMLETASRFQSF